MNVINPFSHLDCQFTVRESKRAKRINLRIKPPKTVELTIPCGSSLKKGLRFAKEHQDWVVQKLESAQQKTLERVRPVTSESNFTTKQHIFCFKPHKLDSAFIRVNKKETHIHYPQQWSDTDERVQDMVKIAIRETYRIEAKEYLPVRLNKLAKANGFIYNKVSVRDSKKRWGSCSAQKNISLSLSLMSLPDHLIDYILLHELCHTIEMNHSPRFYALLNKVSGGKSDMLKKELKKYSIS